MSLLFPSVGSAPLWGSASTWCVIREGQPGSVKESFSLFPDISSADEDLPSPLAMAALATTNAWMTFPCYTAIAATVQTYCTTNWKYSPSGAVLRLAESFPTADVPPDTGQHAYTPTLSANDTSWQPAWYGRVDLQSITAPECSLPPTDTLADLEGSFPACSKPFHRRQSHTTPSYNITPAMTNRAPMQADVPYPLHPPTTLPGVDSSSATMWRAIPPSSFVYHAVQQQHAHWAIMIYDTTTGSPPSLCSGCLPDPPAGSITREPPADASLCAATAHTHPPPPYDTGWRHPHSFISIHPLNMTPIPRCSYSVPIVGVCTYRARTDPECMCDWEGECIFNVLLPGLSVCIPLILCVQLLVTAPDAVRQCYCMRTTLLLLHAYTATTTASATPSVGSMVASEAVWSWQSPAFMLAILLPAAALVFILPTAGVILRALNRPSRIPVRTHIETPSGPGPPSPPTMVAEPEDEANREIWYLDLASFDLPSYGSDDATSDLERSLLDDDLPLLPVPMSGMDDTFRDDVLRDVPRLMSQPTWQRSQMSTPLPMPETGIVGKRQLPVRTGLRHPVSTAVAGVRQVPTGCFEAYYRGKHIGVYITLQDAANAMQLERDLQRIPVQTRKHKRGPQDQPRPSTGMKGIRENKYGKFEARYRDRHLGTFRSIDEASDAWNQAHRDDDDNARNVSRVTAIESIEAEGFLDDATSSSVATSNSVATSFRGVELLLSSTNRSGYHNVIKKPPDKRSKNQVLGRWQARLGSKQRTFDTAVQAAHAVALHLLGPSGQPSQAGRVDNTDTLATAGVKATAEAADAPPALHLLLPRTGRPSGRGVGGKKGLPPNWRADVRTSASGRSYTLYETCDGPKTVVHSAKQAWALHESMQPQPPPVQPQPPPPSYASPSTSVVNGMWRVLLSAVIRKQEQVQQEARPYWRAQLQKKQAAQLQPMQPSPAQAPPLSGINVVRTPGESTHVDTSGTIKDGVDVLPSHLPGANRGLFVTRAFPKGSLITEYCGTILPDQFAAARCAVQTTNAHPVYEHRSARTTR